MKICLRYFTFFLFINLISFIFSSNIYASTQPITNGWVFVKYEKILQKPNSPLKNFIFMPDTFLGSYDLLMKKIQKKYKKKKNIKFFPIQEFVPKKSHKNKSTFMQSLKNSPVDAVLFFQALYIDGSIETREDEYTRMVPKTKWVYREDYFNPSVVGVDDPNKLRNIIEYDGGTDLMVVQKMVFETEKVTKTYPQAIIVFLYRVMLIDVKNSKLLWDGILYLRDDISVYRNKPEQFLYLIFKKAMKQLKKHGFVNK